MRADKIVETQAVVGDSLDRQNRLIEANLAYERLEENFNLVQERLMNLDIMLDNRGWSEVYGTNAGDAGPDLDQVQRAAEELRALTAQNAHLKQGNLLRANYVWNGGINYENVPGPRQGKGINVQAYIEDDQNRREFFGAAARKKRSKALYTDGHAIYLGEEKTKRLKAIDFTRITGTITNPEDPAEVWALRLATVVRKNNAPDETIYKWYFVNGFQDKAKGSTIQNSGNLEPIDKTKRVFIRRSNGQTGWTWGTPDALAAMAWVRQYREFLLSGKKMSDAMAMLWAQYKGDTTKANQNAASSVNTTGQSSGGIAVGGGEFSTLSTAGKGYDFGSGQPLLAAAATALQVSVVALSSNPGASGSSYGAAQTLDLPGRMAIEAIRDEEAEFDEEILRWMGAKDDVRAWFNSLVDGAELYRLIQSVALKNATGGYEPNEIRTAIEKIYGNPAEQKAADGAMIPNNTRFPGTLTNDTQPAATSTAAPDQGVSNGTGGQAGGDNNDLRTDKVS